MGWIYNHKRILHAAVLALLVAAFVGPWSFDQINVPAKYTCDAPFVRLEGDFCGLPMTGLWIPWMLVSQIYQLVTGGYAPSNMASALLAVAGFGLVEVALLLPFIFTLYAVLRAGRRRFSALSILIWAVAVLAALFYAVELNSSPGGRALWGIWLYLGVAVAALALEVVEQRGRSRLDHPV